MRAYALLALLGLAQTADMCVYEETTYTTADCSGDGTTKEAVNTEADKCTVDGTTGVKYSGCTDKEVKMELFAATDCSGTAAGTITLKADTCTKSTDGKTSTKVLQKGGVITTVAWGSVVLAMIAAQF